MSESLLFVILFASIMVADIQAGPVSSPVHQSESFFRKDYKYDAESQAFYKEHSTPKNWGDAVFTCAAEGAQLATPLTEADALALLKHMMNGTKCVYLGIHDLYSEGYFITLNGTPISDIYRNWRQSEPNNVGGEEHCLHYCTDGFYNDVKCDIPRKFICKKDLSTLTNNPLCETHDTEYFYSLEADRCYKVHTTGRKWSEAYTICLAEESHLGIINSAEEAAIYVDAVKRYPPESLKGNIHKQLVHLGFNELISSGDFKTVYGQSLAEAGYEEWAGGQPDNYGGGEHCGSMYRDGKLNDFACAAKAMFICEKNLKKSQSSGIDIRFGKAV